jgi:hypothetical protein
MPHYIPVASATEDLDDHRPGEYHTIIKVPVWFCLMYILVSPFVCIFDDTLPIASLNGDTIFLAASMQSCSRGKGTVDHQNAVKAARDFQGARV